MWLCKSRETRTPIRPIRLLASDDREFEYRDAGRAREEEAY
tara:strand:- start:2393 stop:2515 length:123 start_codon:yes stop_codon:yes gene_type:complete